MEGCQRFKFELITRVSFRISNCRYVEFLRVGGTSSTFDLSIKMTSGQTIEFSQIDRNEVGSLQSYVSKCKLKVGFGIRICVCWGGGGGRKGRRKCMSEYRVRVGF